MTGISELLHPLRELHAAIRDAVVLAMERQSTAMACVAREGQDDTIYEIDVVSEDVLLEFFERLSSEVSFVLIAEGIENGKIVYPRGSDETAAACRIIVDPIDGTRGLMYQKRSGWILTGVAPNRGPQTSLQDITLALQTEIPLVKQHLSDQLWAEKGKGAHAVRFNRLTGGHAPLSLHPSSAKTIAHGFAMISRFFPGSREELASIDEEVVRGALGPIQPGKSMCFEDQYISSGGQFYELMAGHDRFVADLRPLVSGGGLCCHPYDVCTALVASELGVVLTGAAGGSLNAPLNVTANVAWAGYANEHIRAQVEPLLHGALRRRGWI